MIWIALWFVAAVVLSNCWVISKIVNDIAEIRKELAEKEDDLK